MDIMYSLVMQQNKLMETRSSFPKTRYDVYLRHKLVNTYITSRLNCEYVLNFIKDAYNGAPELYLKVTRTVDGETTVIYKSSDKNNI